MISNEVRFDDSYFLRRNRQMIDDHLTNLADIDVVSLDRGGMRWINYDSSVDLNDFEKVHSGGSSDSYILRPLVDPDLYMGVKREDFFKSFKLLSKRTDELLFSTRALVAQMKEELVTRPEALVTGVPAVIDVNKQPKNFRDAMSREDRQEWAEAYDSEYQGFLEQ